MRLTASLHGMLMKRAIKNLWKTKGVLTKPRPIAMRELEEKGIEIVDPTEEEKKVHRERWVPPVDNPALWREPSLEQQTNWNEEPAYTFSHQCRLLEGQKQAMLLSKSQEFSGMPEAVQRLIRAIELPDQDRLVQSCIMQSQVWNPTMDKLPKRFDTEKVGWHFQREYGIPQPKAIEILMRGLLMKCQTLAGRFPSLLMDRRMIYKPYMGSHYYFEGDKLINIQGQYDWLISGDKPLPPFVGENIIDESVSHCIPDIWPVSPTIDVLLSNNYTIQNEIGFTHAYVHHHPQLFLMKSKSHWSTTQKNAVAIMYCLGHCLAQAKYRYGENVTSLPEPISVQCVHMDHQQLDFIFFQLNTLNFSNNDGVKNLVWIDSDNFMYQKHLPKPWRGPEYQVTQYVDYDPEVFRKLLAVYLYGVPGVQEMREESSDQQTISASYV